MAHTRTFPLDYQKRIVLIDHLKRLCNQCGGFCAPDHDNGGFFCMSCESTDVAEVMESKVDDFRATLLMLEYQKAQRYIDGVMNTQDEIDTDALLAVLS
jgi:hypothetical protein